MLSDQIKQIDKKARENFTYVSDPKDYDNWRSHADNVDSGWSGDCDDLTSTILDLLSRDGMPAKNLYRCLVSTKGDNIVDHMIGFVWDDENQGWVVGDTFGAAYPAKMCEHNVLMYQSLDDLQTWRDGAPWS